MEIKDLKPQRVFEIFDEITRIPRPPKKKKRSVLTSSTLPKSMA